MRSNDVTSLLRYFVICKVDMMLAYAGIIRKLVVDPRYFHHVVQHEGLMDSLASTSFWKGMQPVPTRKMTFGRFKSDDGIRKMLPGVVEAAIVPNSDGAKTITVGYGLLVLQLAINTVISDSSNHASSLLTSAQKLLSPEGCTIDLSTLTAYDCTRTKLEVMECGW